MSTVLLTGLPRSGTTLMCAWLNEFPDTVALAEPILLSRGVDRATGFEEICAFLAQAREQALATGAATSKHVNGVVPDNWAEAPSITNGQRLRQVLEVHGTIQLDKPLTEHFTLVVKHPAMFSALADLLAPRYPMFALVRDPIAVLAAWQTVNMPVNRGRMPVAETFAPDLKARLGAIADRIDRQVALIGWLLSVYSRDSRIQVLRYEDMIANPLEQLRRLAPNSRTPDRRPDPFELTERYIGVDFRDLARRLMTIVPIIEPFYPHYESRLSSYLG
jgi:hypothetical protein